MSDEPLLLNMFNKLKDKPAGKKLFSMGYARMAPYFSTIKPYVTEVRPNYAEVIIKKRRIVQNHIGTVHVIAICNGLEMAMGAVAESSIPKHLRWIPRGMDVKYTAKASSDIRCVATSNPEDWEKPGDLPVKVQGIRDDGTVVVDGTIMLYVSEKPKKED